MLSCWLLRVGCCLLVGSGDNIFSVLEEMMKPDNIFSVLEEMMKPDAAVNHWAGPLAQYRIGLGQQNCSPV